MNHLKMVFNIIILINTNCISTTFVNTIITKNNVI